MEAEGFDAATDYRASMPQFTQEVYEKNDALFEFLRRIAAEHGATTGQISLAWMLEKRPWIVPIPGTRKVERMHENLAAADIRLSLAEVEAIDAELDRIPTSGVFGGTRVEAWRVRAARASGPLSPSARLVAGRIRDRPGSIHGVCPAQTA